MFEPVLRQGVFYGLRGRRENIEFFFGGRETRAEDLGQLFPHYHFCFVRQVHGRHVVEGQLNQQPEADALWTSTPHLAMVIQTADCLPILMADTQLVCAVHAGWRGVEQNISHAVALTLPHFHPRWLMVGPHIQSQSFAVGDDVAERLLAAAPHPSSAHDLISREPNDKAHFDLSRLTRLQLRADFGDAPELISSAIDTFVDSRFHSFRRDRQTAGRQLSFVVINR